MQFFWNSQYTYAIPMPCFDQTCRFRSIVDFFNYGQLWLVKGLSSSQKGSIVSVILWYLVDQTESRSYIGEVEDSFKANLVLGKPKFLWVEGVEGDATKV